MGTKNHVRAWMNQLRNGQTESPQVVQSNRPQASPSPVQNPYLAFEDLPRRLIVIPQLPIEVPELLVALGAQRVDKSSAQKIVRLKEGEVRQHCLVLELPPTLTVTRGRLAGPKEYEMSEEGPVWVPRAIRAPDGTLLMNVKLPNVTFNDAPLTSVIGPTWIETADRVVRHEGHVELPRDVIHLDCNYSALPPEEMWEIYAANLENILAWDLTRAGNQAFLDDEGLEARFLKLIDLHKFLGVSPPETLVENLIDIQNWSDDTKGEIRKQLDYLFSKIGPYLALGQARAEVAGRYIDTIAPVRQSSSAIADSLALDAV